MYSTNIIYTKVIYVTKAQPNTIPFAETIHVNCMLLFLFSLAI